MRAHRPDHDSLAAPLNPERAEPGETVLIVDDEPTVRMLVADVLGDFGYVALEAGEGRCCVAVASLERTHRFADYRRGFARRSQCAGRLPMPHGFCGLA